MEIILIQSKIHHLRGQKVMLDFDLAELYGVETKNLNLSVKRNLKRFPHDFMFQVFIICFLFATWISPDNSAPVLEGFLMARFNLV
jgi:hypothetical protein